MSETPLVSATSVSTHFASRSVLDRRPAVQAVSDVTLRMRSGERLALVGESGSGKTTLARTLLGLTPATDGAIEIDGIDVRRLKGVTRSRLRRAAQFVHQDPQGSLSPRMKVRTLLVEPYRIHGVEQAERWTTERLLEMVGLNSEQADKYPHELSGGQARRVGIARALALRPKLLVADEPTAGLDVSAAGDILNLIKNVSSEFGIGYMIVTHNLNTVAFTADTIAVMYLGSIVEQGPTHEVLRTPAHPYTQALIDAVPEADPSVVREQPLLGGEVPSARTPPPGCRFHPRCPLAFDRCRTEPPELLPVADDRYSACHISSQVLNHHTLEDPSA